MSVIAACAFWVVIVVTYVYGIIRAAAFLMGRANDEEGDLGSYQRLVVKRQMLWAHVSGEVDSRPSWTVDVNELLPLQGESATRLFEKLYIVTCMLEHTKDEHAFLKKEREHCLRELTEADDRCTEVEINAAVIAAGLDVPGEWMQNKS